MQEVLIQSASEVGIFARKGDWTRMQLYQVAPSSAVGRCSVPPPIISCVVQSLSASEHLSSQVQNIMSRPIHSILPSLTLPPISSFLPASYKCPLKYGSCDVERFQTKQKLIEHVQIDHLEVNALFSTTIASPQESCPPPSLWHCTDMPSPPETKGWFNPGTRHAQVDLGHVLSKSLEKLYYTFWTTDPLKAIYGASSPLKENSADESKSDDALTGTKEHHHNAERMRRRNQHVLSHEIVMLTTEICFKLADNDEQMAAFKSKSSSSKGPGKYDHMFSDAYFHIVAAIVMQS